MRIDSPQVVGSLTLAEGSTASLSGSFSGSHEGKHSGSFSGSFQGDGAGLTNVAPIGGTGVTVAGTTVNIGQDVATTSSVSFNIISASVVNTTGNIDVSGDLNVEGTASFAYLQSVTGSAKIIGDSIIILNNNTPAERYAGISVQDSGSTNDTASFLFDGQVNDWFYEYTDDNGATYDYASAMFSPATSTKGSPTYPVSESLLIGTGGHHITSSIIHASDSEVRIHGAISASSTGEFSGLGIGTAPSGTIGAILATNDVVAFASSDERLKENVTLIGSALDKVESLRGVEFDWIANEEIHPNNGHDLGVIAQEVEAVLPVLVQTRDNGYKAVKYDKLTAVLIEAVKELSSQVKELQNK